mgnify:CR=1 FL=1
MSGNKYQQKLNIMQDSSLNSVVTTNLYMYTDNANGVTTNYALYLNYSNNQIKFIEN